MQHGRSSMSKKADNATQCAMYRQKAKQRGVCVKCMSKPAAKGRRCCEVCLAKMRANTVMVRKERKEQGLCLHCGRPLAELDDGFTSHHRNHCYPHRRISEK